MLGELKKVGYNTNRLRKDKIMGEATIQKLRNREQVSWKNIDIICNLLNCQPGDIMEYIPVEANSKEVSHSGN